MRRTYWFVAGGVLIVALGLFWFLRPAEPPEGSLETLAQERAVADTARFTFSDVAAHAREVDCWTVIGDGVYDITSFIPQHPGGRALLPACGKDGSTLFAMQPEHAEAQAMAVMESTYRIGTIER